MSQRRSIIKHPHEYAGAPQILSPAEGFGERFDPSFLTSVGGSSSGNSNGGEYQGVGTYGAGVPAAPGVGPGGSSSSGGPSSSSRGVDYDLIPQRSAPLPPGAASSLSSPSTYARSGGASSGSSTMVNKPAFPAHSSQGQSSFRPGMPPNESSGSGSLPTSGAMLPSNRSGFPSGSTGLPAGYVSPSAPAPPRPVRSQTSDASSDGRYALQSSSQFSPSNGSAGASGFVPVSARSHASIGGPAPSPHLTSPHQSPRTPVLDSNWGVGLGTSLDDAVSAAHSTPTTPASTQSQFLRTNSSRSTGTGGDMGRNTFKSVFGGFVNSMSGEWSSYAAVVLSR